MDYISWYDVMYVLALHIVLGIVIFFVVSILKKFNI